jgi:hypothetical protein
MMQIFSVQVAKLPADAAGSVELYGYIAARDELDPLLNYVVNISRDDPITVAEGSLIPMTGPKRGIELGKDMMDTTLIEYDMRIKIGEEHERDDLQILDGASVYCTPFSWDRPYKLDTPGEFGTIDITLSPIMWAVEATLEVLILDVLRGFNLCLVCLTSGFNREIVLFDGAIGESRGLKRSVVAVEGRSVIDLKFNVDAPLSTPRQHCCSFKAETHGHVTQNIKTEFALISVKVTWSTLPSS